ncbi:MAG: hypothetical protein RL701_2118 [Pseudomonadota bacterium]|jgi:glutathione S-transferase
MTNLRVWGQPRSINVQKVLWALEELGVPYERIDAGGSFGKVATSTTSRSCRASRR